MFCGSTNLRDSYAFYCLITAISNVLMSSNFPKLCNVVIVLISPNFNKKQLAKSISLIKN